MFEKVTKFIHETNILQQDDRIVIGVSGGADSMCLLHVLMRYREMFHLTLTVVHVNHCIRGEEADTDQRLVEQFCTMYEIPYNSFRVQIKVLAKQRGLGEEETGRLERYRIFEEERIRTDSNKIAVAHHLDDNAETVLYQLFRGSGLPGLTGIHPVRDSVIRPLLCVSRKEIEDYMDANRLEYRIDSTNLTGDYNRNVIRNELLPIIEEKINARAREHIAKTAEMMNEIEAYLQKQTIGLYKSFVIKEKSQECFCVPVDALAMEDIVLQKRLIKMVMEDVAGQKKDIEAVHITDTLSLLGKQVGKKIHLPFDMIAERGYQHLVFYKRCKSDNKKGKAGTGMSTGAATKNILWKQTPDFILESKETEIVLSKGEEKLYLNLCKYDKNSKIPKNEYTKWFDYDKIMDTLTVRTQQESDFIQINAAGHSKRITEYLKDKKVPKEDRNSIVFLAAGSHILWIPGYRSSEGFHVDENTETILVAKLMQYDNLYKDNAQQDTM